MIYNLTELIGITLFSLFIIIFFLIVIFITITSVKIMKLWKFMNLKYPNLQRQIPAFIRKKDVSKWYKENHEFVKSTLKRFILFEALSKPKSDNYFNKAYNMELIKKQNSKELESAFNSLINYSKIRDKFIVKFYVVFLLILIFETFT